MVGDFVVFVCGVILAVFVVELPRIYAVVLIAVVLIVVVVAAVVAAAVVVVGGGMLVIISLRVNV